MLVQWSNGLICTSFQFCFHKGAIFNILEVAKMSVRAVLGFGESRA
jgi:hypothetical protein